MNTATRTEHDFIGEREIPADAYYGVQTLRAVENFNITGIKQASQPLFIKAFGEVKKPLPALTVTAACWNQSWQRPLLLPLKK